MFYLKNIVTNYEKILNLSHAVVLDSFLVLITILCILKYLNKIYFNLWLTVKRLNCDKIFSAAHDLFKYDLKLLENFYSKSNTNSKYRYSIRLCYLKMFWILLSLTLHQNIDASAVVHNNNINNNNRSINFGTTKSDNKSSLNFNKFDKHALSKFHDDGDIIKKGVIDTGGDDGGAGIKCGNEFL